jgi:RNA polymerase sigma factor (TIGR02999 family)
MGGSPSSEITRLLNGAGDREELAGLVHSELRKIAARMMHSERSGHTLQATTLATDAYMGLVGRADQDWRSRAHFFAVAARAMRNMLVDHSRKKNALKRGGMLDRLEDPDLLAANIQAPEIVLALDQVLTRLSKKDPLQARIVELRYFGGLTEEEVAELLSLSPRTVRREWSSARAWLFAELTRMPAQRPPD